MAALALDVLLGAVIGLALGLLGGGGSILTVPALVYVAGQSPQAAVTASLIIVGANSALGAVAHRRQGTQDIRTAVAFGGAGMAASFLAAGASKSVSPVALLVAFSILMIVVGAFMLLRKVDDRTRAGRGLPATLAAGAGVGALTGFLGVGGGFVIVPALVMLVGLPMNVAVGTSLIVIAMNSVAGLLGHLGGPALDVPVVVAFVAGGLGGVMAGTRAARHIRAERLRQIFAVFVIVLGLFLLFDNGGKLLA